MVYGDLIIDLMFIFIVIGSGLIGLIATLLITTLGAGTIGTDLTIIMDGIDPTGLGIVYGILITTITLFL